MTTATETKVPKGYWQDANGSLVPEKKVKPIDKLRTKTVIELCELAKKHQQHLAEFKANSMAKVQDFVAQSWAEFDVKYGGKKGNLSLMSFDGRYRVRVQVAENIVFDERLQAAKALIDECILRWGSRANRNLMTLVLDAFKVDGSGNVSTGKVLGLRRHDIEDEQWQKAMNLITESVQVVGSKPYIRFYERNDATGAYENISVDVASV